MTVQLLVIFVLIVANGLLAGAEIAIVSVRSTRLRQLVEERRVGALALQRLRDDPERFLATVQVGITVVGATAAAFGGASLAEDLAPWLAQWEILAPHAEPVALVLVVTMIAFLSVVVGELVPKSLALRVSEPYALLAAKPLLGIAAVARPAIWILTSSSNLILKLFGDHTSFTESRVSIHELQQVVGEARRGGSIDEATAELATRAIDMHELTAEDVMVHRRFVDALPSSADLPAMQEAFLKSGHRRIPVHAGSIDDVIGYVSWRDVLEHAWSGSSAPASELLRPISYVPQTRLAVGLLREMREKRLRLAVVLDEHGGVAGIVTLEDLLEELVGDMDDEHDKAAPAPAPAPCGTIVVPGPTPLRDLERMLGVDLGATAAGATTAGGLALALAGDRIPSSGESFSGGGVHVVVLDASPRRVRTVSIRRAEPER